MWRVRENGARKIKKRGRGFTAAPAGRLRLGGGFFRRRSGGGSDPRAAAAAGNPSSGSARGMPGRALAFPEETEGAVAVERSGREWRFAGGKR
jgi:hypothetical protein